MLRHLDRRCIRGHRSLHQSGMEAHVTEPHPGLALASGRAAPTRALRRLGVALGLVRPTVPAFAQLVRTHQGMVRGFLRRLCDSDAIADDLAQDTFLKAQRALPSFRGEGTLASWLLRIAYREFLGHKRKRGVELLAEIGDIEDGKPQTPDRTLARDVRRALRDLSADERAAIAACFFDELTHEEAAVALDMPLGTVKSHVARAKEKLRGPLAAYAPAKEEPHDR